MNEWGRTMRRLRVISWVLLGLGLTAPALLIGWAIWSRFQ